MPHVAERAKNQEEPRSFQYRLRHVHFYANSRRRRLVLNVSKICKDEWDIHLRFKIKSLLSSLSCHLLSFLSKRRINYLQDFSFPIFICRHKTPSFLSINPAPLSSSGPAFALCFNQLYRGPILGLLWLRDWSLSHRPEVRFGVPNEIRKVSISASFQ